MKFKVVSDDKRRIKIDWDKVNLYASRYKPNTPFEVTITRRQPRRSDPMRKLYFGAILPPFMEHLGYERDEQDAFHNQLKIVYFQVKQDPKGIYRNIPSVFSNDSKIPISEKRKFVDWVVRKAAQSGCYIETES